MVFEAKTKPPTLPDHGDYTDCLETNNRNKEC
jgi:hypothetical protein